LYYFVQVNSGIVPEVRKTDDVAVDNPYVAVICHVKLVMLIFCSGMKWIWWWCWYSVQVWNESDGDVDILFRYEMNLMVMLIFCSGMKWIWPIVRDPH